MKKPEVQ